MTNVQSTAKLIKISNDNNRLANKVFTVIHFAPPEGKVDASGTYKPGFPGWDKEPKYVVEHEGTNIFVKLIDITHPIQFKDIHNVFTYPSCGQDSYHWKVDFMTRYPQTTNETPMAVYYYERVE